MITNTGKDIIAKYLIGQAPAYASYMAFGSGPKPLGTGDTLGDYSAKQNLDFELFRAPITSRGYVTDLVWDPTAGGGSGAYVEVSKIVFTAELPPEQRYRISEVGLYSAKSNPSAGVGDSRMIHTLSASENWIYHNQNSEQKIESINSALYGITNDGIVKVDLSTYPVFRTSSDNAIFDSSARQEKYESCRLLDTIMVLPGSMSNLYLDAVSGELKPKTADLPNNLYYGTHIHLDGVSVDLSKNSPDDELKFAYSVFNRDETYATYQFSKVKILVEFSSDDSVATAAANYAKFQIERAAATYATSRYQVETKKLSELKKSTAFSWGAVKLTKIYASVFDSVTVTTASRNGSGTATITTARKHGFRVGESVVVAGVSNAIFNGTWVIKAVSDNVGGPYTFSFDLAGASASSSGGTAEAPSSNYYVAVDGIRFDNVSTVNPLYGLTGYSLVKTEDAQPISKDTNSSGVVEFRFGMDVI